jgi:diadenosine tetraphosphate (Ap4A) HIT family hydrolase
MQQRIWDPDNAYPGGYLKSYRFWTAEISYRQHTLGSFIIFANRSVEKMSDLTAEEITELPLVMKDIEGALADIPVLRPDRFNYLQLGNAVHHLHIHGIPRYEKNRSFLNRDWIDSTYGNVPVWTTKNEDQETVRKIRDLVLEKLQ